MSSRGVSVGLGDARYQRRDDRPLNAANRMLRPARANTTSTDLGGNARVQVYIHGTVRNLRIGWANWYQSGTVSTTGYQETTTGLTDLKIACTVKSITNGWTFRFPMPDIPMLHVGQYAEMLSGLCCSNELIELQYSWSNPSGAACGWPCCNGSEISSSLNDSYEVFPTATTFVDQSQNATGFTSGGFQSLSTGSVNRADVLRPVFVGGEGDDPVSLVAVGDSIVAGIGSTQLSSQTVSGYGYNRTASPGAEPGIVPMLAYASSLPYLIVAAGGNEAALEKPIAQKGRARLFERGNLLLVNFGTNDLASYAQGVPLVGSDYASLLAALKTRYATLLQSLKAYTRGDVVVLGPYPRSAAPTTTTQLAGLVDPTAQSAYAITNWSDAILAFRDWMLGGAGSTLGSFRYLDPIAVLGDASNPLRWKYLGAVNNANGGAVWTLTGGSTSTAVVSNSSGGDGFNVASNSLVDCVVEFLTLNGVAPSAADRYRIVTGWSLGSGTFTFGTYTGVSPSITQTLSVAAKAGDTIKVHRAASHDLTHPSRLANQALIDAGVRVR